MCMDTINVFVNRNISIAIMWVVGGVKSVWAEVDDEEWPAMFVMTMVR